MSGMGVQRRANLLVHQRNNLPRQGAEKLDQQNGNVPEMRSFWICSFLWWIGPTSYILFGKSAFRASDSRSGAFKTCSSQLCSSENIPGFVRACGIVKLGWSLADCFNDNQYSQLSSTSIPAGYNQPFCFAISLILPELPRC